MATMEDLTKNQMVLLTLLVSFITSMATGIITASLLAEAPTSVTQTINRVVEHTIEKVTPAATSTGSTVKEVTVVKEEDAILSSMDKTTRGVIRINVQGGDGVDIFYGLGALVTREGLVVTDGQGLLADGTYTAILHDGSSVPAKFVSKSEDSYIAIFKLTSATTTQTYTAIPISNNELKLGQTIVAFEGKTSIGVAVGRVSSLTSKPEANGTRMITSILTDLSLKGETAGGPLVNLSGELVGLKSSSADFTLPAGIYTAIAPIKAQISAQAAR